MIEETAICLQTCLIDLNSYSRLQQQYLGFLKTAQLHFDKTAMPYESFKLNEYTSILPDDFIMPHPIRLGQRMEVFMANAIAEVYQITAKNLQIISDKKTVGEVDFLLEHKASKENVHLEMVYKFYFYRPEVKGNWIARLQGPNAKDHLQLKLNKLRSKQFPLLYKEETKPDLEALNLDVGQIKQHLLFKAQVFTPLEGNHSDYKSFKPAIAGNFFTIEQLLTLNYPHLRFYIPIKHDWVAQPDANARFVDFKLFRQKISAILKEQRSSLFWVYNNEERTICRHFASWW